MKETVASWVKRGKALLIVLMLGVAVLFLHSAITSEAGFTYRSKEPSTMKTFCVGRYMIEFDSRLSAQFHIPQTDKDKDASPLMTNAVDGLIVYIHEYDKPLDKNDFEVEIKRSLESNHNYDIQDSTIFENIRFDSVTKSIIFEHQYPESWKEDPAYNIRGFKYINNKIFEFREGPNKKNIST